MTITLPKEFLLKHDTPLKSKQAASHGDYNVTDVPFLWENLQLDRYSKGLPAEGQSRKMTTELGETIRYSMRLGDDTVDLNKTKTLKNGRGFRRRLRNPDPKDPTQRESLSQFPQ